MEAPSKRTLLLAGGLVALLTATGCGGGGSEVGGYGGAPDSPGAEAEDIEEEVPTPETGSGAALTVQEGTPFGDVIADANGQTVYVFTEDSNEPPTSNCAGECAEQWPPVWANGEISTNGVDQSLVGQVSRDNDPRGDSQLTLNGWPLYTYTGDGGAGFLNGHAYAAKWFALAPDGSMIDDGGGGETGDGQDDTGAQEELDDGFTDDSP